MRIPFFLTGFLVAVAYWPGIVASALAPRWAAMAVLVALCLLLTRARPVALGGWGAVIVALIGLTLAWTPDIYAGVGMYVHVLILASVFVLGATAKDLTPVWIGYAVGIIPSAVIALEQRFIELAYFDQVSAAPTGLFVNPNIMGEAAAIALIAMVAQRKWFLAIAPFICVWLAHSRGVYGGLAIALAFWLMASRPKIAGMIFWSTIAAGISWLWYADGHRFDYWTGALQGLTLFGNGLESYVSAFPAQEHAHQEILQLVYELGIFATPIFALGLYALGGAHGIELSIFACILAIGFLSFPLHMPATAFAAALAAGYLVSGRVRLRHRLLYGRDADGSRIEPTGRVSWPVSSLDGRRGGYVSIFAPYPVHPGRTARRNAQSDSGGFPPPVIHFTQDEAGLTDDARVVFYTVEKIGPKRSLTPEGFLVCHEVPIARTGEMLYGPGETPIPVGDDGAAHVWREEDEVFRPEFIASFMGKPVVNDHPPRDVNPTSWLQYARGTVINPRRGVGSLDQLLIADLMICDADAILAVNDGKVEVSCGYEAEYEETGPGKGRQTNMIANHVALVAAGRCGSRCSIGDRAKSTTTASTGDCHMGTKTKDKRTLAQRIAAVLGIKTNDEEKIDAIANELPDTDDGADEPGGDTHVHVHGGERNMTDEALEERFGNLESGHQEIKDSLEALHSKLGAGGPAGEDVTDVDEEEAAKAEAEKAEDEEVEGNLKEEAPAGATGDAIKKAIKTGDSAFLGDSFQQTVADAEILVPGIRVPTFDRKTGPKDTFDAMCSLRRNALDLAYATPEGRSIIVDLTKDHDFMKMSCADVRTVFKGAAKVKKAITARAGDRTEIANPNKKPIGIKSLAELNAAHAKHYGTN